MKKERDFESSLARLEELLEEMEKKDLPLQELLARFGEGVELLAFCRQQLEEAQGVLEGFEAEA